MIFLTYKDFLNSSSLEKAFNWKYFQVFSYTKYSEFKHDLLEIMRSSNFFNLTTTSFRVWKSNLELNSLYEEFKNQTLERQSLTTDSSMSYAVDGEIMIDQMPGKTLKQFDFKDDVLVVIELKNGKDWILKIKEKKPSITPIKRNFSSFMGSNGVIDDLPLLQENGGYTNVYTNVITFILKLLIIFFIS